MTAPQLNQQPSPIERLWTAADVAAFLGCSRQLVYMKAKSGELPCTHVGSLVRFVPEEIRAMFTSKPLAPPAATNVVKLTGRKATK